MKKKTKIKVQEEERIKNRKRGKAQTTLQVLFLKSDD